jgi:RimJ/RimL family protein N-acetyltransferase
VLRDPRPADAAAYVQAFSDDPDLARNMGFDAPSVARMRRVFRREPRDRADGTVLRYAVSDEAGAFHGLVLLHSFSWPDRRGDLGVMVVPAARGHGLAAEALRLLVRWAFASLGLQRVGLATLPGNEPTVRLAERVGFQREGVLRAYTREWDEPRDNVLFSALPGDPEWA